MDPNDRTPCRTVADVIQLAYQLGMYPHMYPRMCLALSYMRCSGLLSNEQRIELCSIISEEIKYSVYLNAHLLAAGLSNTQQNKDAFWAFFCGLHRETMI